MARPRLLVLVGSGETTGTMVSTHKGILSRFGDHRPDARFVDTPYAFQENADALNARAVDYFDRQVGHRFAVTTIRAGDRAGRHGPGRGLAELDGADVVFAGPGSPSYLVDQWRGSAVLGVLRDKLRRGGAVVFASAAACTAGRFTVPVYEIYKVGAEPHWLEGFDLTGELGLDVAVIPHFDNAEGGTHDTRYCFLGERRLRLLEDQLPAGTGVLGIDEHTAVIFDLEADTAEITGRGGMTARLREQVTTWEAGGVIPVDDLREPLSAPGRDRPGTEDRRPDAEIQALDEVGRLRDAFDRVLAEGDGAAAAAVVLELYRLARHDEGVSAGDADQALRVAVARLGQVADEGMHEHRDLVSPFVEALLDLRARARDEGDFEAADEIRAWLVAGGVEVRDTSVGTEWDLTDPPI